MNIPQICEIDRCEKVADFTVLNKTEGKMTYFCQSCMTNLDAKCTYSVYPCRDYSVNRQFTVNEKNSTISFRKLNNIPYGQDHSFFTTIPPSDFKVKMIGGGLFSLTAYGAGVIGQGGDAYGGGSLYIRGRCGPLYDALMKLSSST